MRLILSSVGIINRRDEGFFLYPVFCDITVFKYNDEYYFPKVLRIDELLHVSDRLHSVNKIFPLVTHLPIDINGVPEVMMASIINGDVVSPSKSSLV
jgi:hypothetical protein